MRSVCCIAVVVALAAAGCEKGPSGGVGNVGTSPRGRTIYEGPLSSPVELADKGTQERVVQIVVPYLTGPNYRLRDPQIVNIAKPKKTTRNGQEAEVFYIQFHALNNFALEEQHQNDVFVIQGGQVLEHLRTIDDIKGRMSETWYRNNPPPAWKPIERRTAE